MSRHEDERWAAIDWPAEEQLFDNAEGEYPPAPSVRLVLRHGRWIPVVDGPAIDDYQPATERAGQPGGEER